MSIDRFKRAVVIALVIISVGCAYAIWEIRDIADDAENASSNAQLAVTKVDKSLTKVKVEGAERRDQNCVLFERSHLQDVKNLRSTYRYLKDLTPPESKSLLNQFIVQNLAKTEKEARIDSAPEYCDAKHTGLPEPDPTLPPKKDFSYLLVQQP